MTYLDHKTDPRDVEGESTHRFLDPAVDFVFLLEEGEPEEVMEEGDGDDGYGDAEVFLGEDV